MTKLAGPRAVEILEALRAHANPVNVAGMAGYGISTTNTLGVPVAVLRPMAKQAGRDHQLALELWASGVHEARILATLIDDPARVSFAPDGPMGARPGFLGRL
jgi:3-methyladenine DNA glycosylase AlkD